MRGGDRQALPTPPVLALAYHSVRPGWAHPLSVGPDAFRAQLRALAARGYAGATLSDAAHGAGAGRPPLVAVTFDDAFASVASFAEPVLDELGWPATVFVPTEAVERGRRLHWLSSSAAPGPEYDPLSWAEVERLAAKGWEIGSHSRTHRRLSLLDDEDVLDELEGSRAAILAHVPRCDAVSYPWGELDPRVVAHARRAGYATGSGLVGRIREDDPMRVPRTAITHRDGRARFRFKTGALARTLRSRDAWESAEHARRALQAAVRAAPRIGPATALAKAQGRLGSTRACIGLARQAAPARPHRGGPAFVVSIVDPLEFGELAALQAKARGTDYLFLAAMERTRVASAGDLVVARTPAGRTAGLLFLHRPRHRRALEAVAPGLYPPLGPGEVLTEALYTVPEFRERGVAGALLEGALDAVAAERPTRAFAYVDVTNEASLRSFHGLGYRPAELVRVDTFRLGRRESRFEPISPRVEAAWNAAVSAPEEPPPGYSAQAAWP